MSIESCVWCNKEIDFGEEVWGNEVLGFSHLSCEERFKDEERQAGEIYVDE